VYSEKSDKESMRLEIEQAKLQDMSEKDVAKEVRRLEKQMMDHARNLEFEQAAATRDQLGRLRALTFGATPQDKV
jgi:excinuclease ABC subunit B